MALFHLEIVTPDGPVFSGEAESLLVRCDSGDVMIMAHHADFFSSLGTGRAKLCVGGEDKNASLSGGFISVKGGEVKVVATTFEFAEDIDLERAEAAKARAEAAIEAAEKAAKDEKTILIAKAKLKRALTRISVAKYK